jgi:hypothetical protein
LSAAGDPLERLALVLNFELLRPELAAALARSDQKARSAPRSSMDVPEPATATASRLRSGRFS